MGVIAAVNDQIQTVSVIGEFFGIDWGEEDLLPRDSFRYE